MNTPEFVWVEVPRLEALTRDANLYRDWVVEQNIHLAWVIVVLLSISFISLVIWNYHLEREIADHQEDLDDYEKLVTELHDELDKAQGR